MSCKDPQCITLLTGPEMAYINEVGFECREDKMKSFEKVLYVFSFLWMHTTFASGEWTFVPITAKKFFHMGSPENEPHRSKDEKKVVVALTRHFEMMSTEVTQLQYFNLTGTNPSLFKRTQNCFGEQQVIGEVKLCPNNPVDSVSWYEIQDFLVKLNEQKNDGYTYRLPTEAEWEYAARAQTTTAYFFGDNSSDVADYAWYWDTADYSPRPVAQKKANPWGLYDIYGNVGEWVQDPYRETLPGGVNPLPDSSSTTEKPYYVWRGGSWMHAAHNLRSSERFVALPDEGNEMVGFRLVRVRNP